jgi:DNA-binding PadR family transcriptional regulator
MPRPKDGLSEFELFVMLALARLGAQAYGVSIRREIQERAGRDVAIGAVYATLGRLEEKGFLASHLSDPVPVRGGRSRRHYQLRPAGERALDESLSMLRRMASGLRRRPAREDA